MKRKTLREYKELVTYMRAWIQPLEASRCTKRLWVTMSSHAVDHPEQSAAVFKRPCHGTMQPEALGTASHNHTMARRHHTTLTCYPEQRHYSQDESPRLQATQNDVLPQLVGTRLGCQLTGPCSKQNFGIDQMLKPQFSKTDGNENTAMRGS